MKTTHWLMNSRSLYATLLNLYPREYRETYAVPMMQVFTDQCLSAYQEHGFWGIIRFWLRIIPDLGYTALLEHFTAPTARWGLMEPVANAPLPWKGVILILLPGLVYLVSQIAQLTGSPWYMTVYYRAAFLLIIPVLIVWAVTRRFPIWGLIPVGLLFRLVQEIGYQMIVVHPDVFSSNMLLNSILNLAKLIQADPMVLSLFIIPLIVFLAVRYLKKAGSSRLFWIWLGLFLVLSMAPMMIGMISLDNFYRSEFITMSFHEFWPMYRMSISWEFYNMTVLLLLVFLGTLFTKRHGFYSIFIMVGYILPVMVVGMPWDLDMLPNKAFVVAILTIAVLGYRAMLSIVAPIWMSRTPKEKDKKRAVIISITIALAIHAVMQFFYPIFYPDYGNITWSWFASVFFEEGKLISAILLALSLYQDPVIRPPEKVQQLAGMVVQKTPSV
jgi:hypothetical protein